MNTALGDKRKTLIKRIFALAGIVAAVFAALGIFLWGARFFAPFITAVLLTMLMEPLIRLMTRQDKSGVKNSKYGLPRSVAVVISMLVVFSIISMLLLLLVNSLITEIGNFARALPTVWPDIYAQVQEWIAWADDNIKLLPPEVLDAIMSAISSLGSKLGEFATSIAGTTVSWATSLPSVILFILFTVMSTYFWASGRFRYRDYFQKSLPESWVKRAGHMYRTMIGTLLGYVRAQIIIMFCMFVLLAIGFMILGVDYVILMALIIAVADALPGIGTGLILMPWGVYHVLFGEFTLGLGLLIVYLCATGLRQILEPRVLSQQIGLHPLITMSAMYAGLKAMGVLGMLVGPVTVIIIKYALDTFLNGRTLREYLDVE